ncbi:RDD family protein [Shewanella gelidii]|uniref:RDD domain-containing protein n=1 Tax=Shewanella gelidii TaxID=1642821 RepID=A0A917JJK0_9GAMM|nr:RDD family protein [Shewanella gelidii]MCL1096503.1 RDD family protein [Shewanella gelidii]GGI67834.1 hypothetical protein GCM10009332_01320 [Shewanella gelidii]
MDSSPNYNNYTLDELLDVQNHIDSEQYPERAKEIKLAISNKASDPATKAEMERQQELDKYSTFGPRFWASIIDGIVISVLSAILAYLGTQAGGGIQATLGYIDTMQFAVYSIALHTLYGQTLGKMALDVKVVDHLSEKGISFKQAFLRDCVPVVMLILLLIASLFLPVNQVGETPDWLIYAMMVFGISYFLWHLLEIITMLFNDKNRAMHDFIAGTVVIRT